MPKIPKNVILIDRENQDILQEVANRERPSGLLNSVKERQVNVNNLDLDNVDSVLPIRRGGSGHKENSHQERQDGGLKLANKERG